MRRLKSVDIGLVVVVVGSIAIMVVNVSCQESRIEDTGCVAGLMWR